MGEIGALTLLPLFGDTELVVFCGTIAYLAGRVFVAAMVVLLRFAPTSLSVREAVLALETPRFSLADIVELGDVFLPCLMSKPSRLPALGTSIVGRPASVSNLR